MQPPLCSVAIVFSDRKDNAVVAWPAEPQRKVRAQEAGLLRSHPAPTPPREAHQQPQGHSECDRILNSTQLNIAGPPLSENELGVWC